MTVRKTFQWTLVLAVLVAAGGWYGLRYLNDHKDRLVLDGIREDIARRMPDWGMRIGAAHVDLRGQVMLENILIQPDATQPPLVRIPRCLVTLDTNLLLEQKQVLVRRVRIIKPELLIARNARGEWNWQQLSQPEESGQTPELTIEGGSVLVDLAAADGLPQTQVAGRNVDVRLVVAGSRRYLIQGMSHIDGAGVLEFGGDLDLNTGAWRLTGRADDVEMSQALLEKATAFAPDVGRKVAELSGGRISPGASSPPNPEGGIPIRMASLETDHAAGQLSLPNLGLAANVGMEFDLSSRGPGTPLDYRVLARVVDGVVTEPLSPVPLSNLHGELLVENGRLEIREFTASNGSSRLSVNGHIKQTDGRTLRDFEIVAEQLLIDAELRHLLPPPAQRLFDRLRPAGLFTVRGRFRGDGTGSPQVRLDEFTALDCSIQHELFDYPITSIQGTIKQEEADLVLDLQGLASGRPVMISGTIKNPGPEAESSVAVEVNDLPLDERFRSAIVDPRHRPARIALEQLNLSGVADIRAVFHRAAGLNQPTIMGVDADVRHGTLSYQSFPYALSQVTGHVKYDPWRERTWRFTDLHGQHAASTIDATASYDLTKPNGGELELTLTARDVPLDRDLHRATTTASPQLQEVWNQLNPSPPGVVQLQDVHLTWTPRTVPRIELPSIRVDQATLTMPSFPFRLDQVNGNLSWRDGRVSIRQLAARHGETSVTIDGRSSTTAAYFEILPAKDDARWRLRLEDVRVRNLIPNAEFRRSLPGDVATVVTQANPRGPIDADLGFELAAFPHPQGGPDLLTSQWKLRAQLERDQLAVGVDLDNVTGTVEADIVWDGVRLLADGRLNFSTARALDVTFTDIRAPFAVDDYYVIIGSPSMLTRQAAGSPEPQVPPDEQLQATLYGGRLELSAEARLSPVNEDQTGYRARIRFRDADLRQWAEEWQLSSAGINGRANGALDLEGQGTSELGLRGKNCWMTITDARLGELPVIARMLAQVVSPQQRDSTAFRWAYLEFDIRDGLFDFGSSRKRDSRDTRRIVLSGDSLKMIGQGYVPFSSQLDPRMNLDFYSKAPPNMLSGIPLIGQVAKSLSDNWIHVRVTGLPSDPKIRTQPEVPVDNALRQLLGAMETGITPFGPLPRQ